MLPKLPIGQQDFPKLREERALYVDKTERIYDLVETSGHYFFARPRRFGKSLTLSIIKCLFQGKKELFEGLWIENRWDWSVTHPVVHIGFSSTGYGDIGLERAILKVLDREGAKYGVTLTEEGVSLRFADLLNQLNAKLGRVVILIDEYDKPLIDYLDKESLPQAFANQKLLKRFYSVLKDNDDKVRLLLITGVSKFSKVGVFSDLNNLYDISLTAEFNDLVGITQNELEAYFGSAIDTYEAEENKTEIRGQLREWYNGYSFHDGHYTVYNPWSLLVFFRSWHFGNYWFSTGTPTFLVQLMRERFYYELKREKLDAGSFEAYQLDELQTTPLLFQTGYLTIKNYDEQFGLYTLDYPNREVKDSMLRHLIGAFSHGTRSTGTPAVARLYEAFKTGDVKDVIDMINDLFQTIPHQLFIDAKENLYHALLHLLFTYLGQFTSSEVSVLRGRVDAVVQTDTTAYVLEFKLDRSAKEALQQIQSRDYAAPFRATGKRVVAVGINFSSAEKRVDDWEVLEVG